MDVGHLLQGRRAVPRMELHREPPGLNCWIRFGQLTGFVQGLHVEDENAAERTVVQKGPGENKLVFCCEPPNILHVGLLEFSSPGGILSAVGPRLYQRDDVSTHAIGVCAECRRPHRIVDGTGRGFFTVSTPPGIVTCDQERRTRSDDGNEEEYFSVVHARIRSVRPGSQW